MLYNVLLVSATQQVWLLSTTLRSPHCTAASHRSSLLHTGGGGIWISATFSVCPAFFFPGCVHKPLVYVCISILSCKQVPCSTFRLLPCPGYCRSCCREHWGGSLFELCETPVESSFALLDHSGMT